MKPLHYISQRLRAVLLAAAALATMPAVVRAGDSFTVPSNVINEGKVYRLTGIGDKTIDTSDVTYLIAAILNK